MIERRAARPPVTYTTFQARDLGCDTAELFKTSVRDAYARHQPEAMLVGASCTAELIQDDPGGLARALDLPIPVVPLELPAYQRKENWGAAETLYRVARALAGPSALPPGAQRARARRHAAALQSARPDGPRLPAPRRRRRGHAPARPAGRRRARRCSARRAAGRHRTPRRGRLQRRALSGDRAARGRVARASVPAAGRRRRSRSASARRATSSPKSRRSPEWTRRRALQRSRRGCPGTARSVDSTYLTGKRVFIFGDATHAIAAARVATEELGFVVAGLGTYSREFARDVRAAAARYGVEALITDDYLEVEAQVAELQPELVLGTQMERHIAKRLGIPCAVISAPVHVQDFPARYSPQMGFEGANVLFDTWVHPLMMGLEEHLLTMFRDDFEFHDGAAPSHLGTVAARAETQRPPAAATGAPRYPRWQPVAAPAAPRRRMGAGGGAGAAQDSVLRARQSAPQYRTLRQRARRGHDHRRDAL